jgi:hypothetical protein
MADTRPAELTEAVQVASNWLAVMKHSFVPPPSNNGQFVRRARHVRVAPYMAGFQS